MKTSFYADLPLKTPSPTQFEPPLAESAASSLLGRLVDDAEQAAESVRALVQVPEPVPVKPTPKTIPKRVQYSYD
jgi:hypothetical protein